MDKTVDAALSAISQEYTLTPEDPENYKEIKVYNVFKFDVQQYSVEGVGNLSVMKVNMGFMQMATIILTPIEKIFHWFLPIICINSESELLILNFMTVYLI